MNALALTLPSWLPWWVPLAVLVPVLLYAVVFLLMPFSVIGVKSRLDVIEARLDEMQGEIRNLVLRLPAVEQGGDDRPLSARRSDRDRPPIPPAPRRSRESEELEDDEADEIGPPGAIRAPARPAPIPEDPRRRRPPAREEPKLDWRG